MAEIAEWTVARRTIKEVTVTIHEKRNHPAEDGCYEDGCCNVSVKLVADVFAGDDADEAVRDLVNRARQHVASECNRWTAEIHEGKRVGGA